MIIDAHTHVFPAIKGKTADADISENIHHTPEMLIAQMDFIGVERAVLLQGPYYGECNSYIAEAVKKYPHRLTAAAYFDPWSQDSLEHFQAIYDMVVFRALKIEFSVPTGFSGIYKGITLDSDELEWLWTELEKRKMVLTLDLGGVGSASYRTNDVRRIAERHPRLNIVIAHLGQPMPALNTDPDLYDMWETQLKLAKIPNIWFDTASLATYFQEEKHPFESARKYFIKAVELAGTEKILFGSDIPGTLIHATYYQQKQMMELFVECLNAHEREKILGENAWKVYFN